MRSYLAYSMMLLLALPLMLISGCSDSSEDDQQANADWLDSSDEGDQDNERELRGQSNEKLTSAQLADRAHQRAINAIRQSSDDDGDDDEMGGGDGAEPRQQTQRQLQQPQSQQNPLAAGNDRQRVQTAANNTNTETDANANTNNNAAAPNTANRRPTAQGNGKYSVFVEHKLTDPGMNNAHSHTVLVPEGWKVEGGLIRPNINLYNMPTVIDMKVTAPDGRRACILPAMSFEFNNQNPGQPGSATLQGNLYMPLPESAGKWLLGMAQNNPDPKIKDLKLVSEKMEETLTQQLRKQAAPMYQSTQQLNQVSRDIGVGAVYDTQAQVITFTYTENGQPFEETFLVAWYVNLTTIQGQVSSGLWGITLMISVRDAPGKDPSKDPMIQTIFQSFRPTQAWQNEMNKYWVEIARIKAKGRADRQQQFAKHNEFMRRNNEEINDIIVGGYKNRQSIRDRGHQNNVDTIQEVTPYSTPSGEVVRLPSFYDHAYTDGNGRYLLNNDANYNPNLDPTFNSQNWQTIEQAR